MTVPAVDLSAAQPAYQVGLRSPTSLPRYAGAPGLLAASDDLPRRAFVEQIMGLPMSLHLRGPEATGSAVESAVRAAFSRLRADDAEFSTYREDSAVSRIRRGELAVADASPRLRRVVALCEDASARTDGAFSAWLLAEGVVRFDPSGLVKGWAVEETFERLGAELAGLGRYDALLSAGGDVVVSCSRTDTPDWKIAVEDPADRSRLLTSVPLRVGAVATSGTAARGAHVVDPSSGHPATELLSATVIGPSLTWADVYATALLARGGDAPWCEELRADHLALLVRPDGTTVQLP